MTELYHHPIMQGLTKGYFRSYKNPSHAVCMRGHVLFGAAKLHASSGVFFPHCTLKTASPALA